MSSKFGQRQYYRQFYDYLGAQNFEVVPRFLETCGHLKKIVF
jgi:hypothetical protein